MSESTHFMVIENGQKCTLLEQAVKHVALERVWTVQEEEHVWRHVLQFARAMRASSVGNYLTHMCGVQVAHCSALSDRDKELFAYAYKISFVRDRQARDEVLRTMSADDMRPCMTDTICASLQERVLLCDLYEKERAGHALTREFLLHIMNHVGATIGMVRSAYSMALALDSFAVQHGLRRLPCLIQTHALADASVPAERMLNYHDTCVVLSRLDESCRGALLQRLACLRDETLAWYMGDILHTIPEQRSRWASLHPGT
jgi:hypothetical protein